MRSEKIGEANLNPNNEANCLADRIEAVELQTHSVGFALFWEVRDNFVAFSSRHHVHLRFEYAHIISAIKPRKQKGSM